MFIELKLQVWIFFLYQIIIITEMRFLTHYQKWVNFRNMDRLLENF
jgi:hypothetical protein